MEEPTDARCIQAVHNTYIDLCSPRAWGVILENNTEITMLELFPINYTSLNAV